MRKRNAGVIVAIVLGAILTFVIAAVAQDLSWSPATGWVNSDNAAQTGTFTAAEMATMTFYVRINRSTPADSVGRSGLNRPGTWYYAGEARGGVSKWPGDNNIAGKLQGFGYAGQPVSFTVSQSFKATDGVERDSLLSEVLAWTVPVPFVPKKAGAPGALSLD
jgi:hypothetical protein